MPPTRRDPRAVAAAAVVLAVAVSLIAAMGMSAAARVSPAPARLVAGIGWLLIPIVVAGIGAAVTGRAGARYNERRITVYGLVGGDRSFTPTRADSWRRINGRGRQIGVLMAICGTAPGEVLLFSTPFWDERWLRQVCAQARLRISDRGRFTVGALRATLPGFRLPFWVAHPVAVRLAVLASLLGYLAGAVWLGRG